MILSSRMSPSYSFPTFAHLKTISTNIAETSLTIDDVAFVVDTGRMSPNGIVFTLSGLKSNKRFSDVAHIFIVTKRHIGAKEKDYDPHLNTSTLQPVWISQSSSKQRKGRAGRTKAGVCFHLFSSRRHQSMRPFVESELLRTPLVGLFVGVGMLYSFIRLS